MNTALAPTYNVEVGAFSILWFANSNTYSVVEPLFKEYLDVYLKAKDKASFLKELGIISNEEGDDILNQLESYLKDCNKISIQPEEVETSLDSTKKICSRHYLIKNKSITIWFDSELVQKTVHPALAHLEIEIKEEPEEQFSIYLKEDYLYLFRNEAMIIRVPKRDYHLLQGKFNMCLLNAIYDKKEKDWLGTFHGSTISDGKCAILFIGHSGKGKSTLCSILSAHGFELVADDMSPMEAPSKHIFQNPAAISTKSGAFKVLAPLIPEFEKLPEINFNPNKGPLKYIPCPDPKQDSYSCKAIVMVNYKKEGPTELNPVDIRTILETLIPESWINPNPEDAKSFLEWLTSIKLYELNYSNNDVMVNTISELFNKLHNNN